MNNLLFLWFLSLLLVGCNGHSAKNNGTVSATETVPVSDYSRVQESSLKSDSSRVQESSSESESSRLSEPISVPEYELPATKDGELIIRHTGFTLSYNKSRNTPNWSAWCLTASHTDGTVPRSSKFWADPKVPTSCRVEYYDYKESGYDRGHMCPAGDMKWSEQAMHDCFYMSNMCPQTGALNSGAWNGLEKRCRDWAKKEGRLYIVCGPIYKKGKRRERIGIDHVVHVPDAFFKAVLSLRKGHEKAVAFYFLNDESQQSYNTAAMSVDEIEAITGFDLFAALDDSLESRLETNSDVRVFTK